MNIQCGIMVDGKFIDFNKTFKVTIKDEFVSEEGHNKEYMACLNKLDDNNCFEVTYHDDGKEESGTVKIHEEEVLSIEEL